MPVFFWSYPSFWVNGRSFSQRLPQNCDTVQQLLPFYVALPRTKRRYFVLDDLNGRHPCCLWGRCFNKWTQNFIHEKYIMYNLINDPDWISIPIIRELIPRCASKSIVRIYSPLTRVSQIQGWGSPQGMLLILKTRKKIKKSKRKIIPLEGGSMDYVKFHFDESLNSL